MTEPDRRRPDAPGSRDAGGADVAALADLDAGLPDPERAARARAAAAADPEATAVLEALAATRAELAALPTPDVPADVAQRWTAALAAEARAAGPRGHRRPDRHDAPRDPSPRSPDGPRGPSAPDPGDGFARGRRQRPAWRPLLVAAALAALVGTGLGALARPPRPDAPTVTRVELVALGRSAVGTMDVGDLADPARRVACLRAVAPAAAGETLLGGRRVVVDGRPGVLLVLATGTVGGLRLVVVDPACGPAGGTLRAQLVVG
jgi:hypothetical protein